MPDSVDLQPRFIDLKLYAGDGVQFRFTFRDNANALVNITGTVKAQIREKRLAVDPPVTEFDSDLTDGAEGVVILSLTGDQTQELVSHISSKNGKFNGVWDVEWEPEDSEPYTICQGKVECVADVTR